MPRRPACLVVFAGLLAATLACRSAGAPTPGVSERATRLAFTAAALLTATAQARPPTATAPPLPSQTIAPSPSSTPTSTLVLALAEATTPAPTATLCENDSAFVADVTIPDGTHLAQGTAFVKTWRLRNDGVCPWTTAYSFRPVSGHALGGSTVPLPHAVPAGGVVELSVSLAAPAANGTFRGTWQMHDPAGLPFGSQPYVEIVVP